MSTLTIGEIDAGDLFELLLARNLAPRTAEVYSWMLRRVATWTADRGISMVAMSAQQVRSFAATLPQTRSSLIHLRTSLDHYWQAMGRLDGPTYAIRPPKKIRGRCRALDESDASRLEAHARARADQPGLAVLIGLYLALRSTEIATLRWDAFDGHGFVRIYGKGQTVADLPVHEVLAAELAARLYGSRISVHVFPGRFGDSVTKQTIWNWVRLVAADAGLKTPLTTHQLRHTSLAMANDATGDLRAVQEFARHARPETTAIYTRVDARRLGAVVGALDFSRARS